MAYVIFYVLHHPIRENSALHALYFRVFNETLRLYPPASAVPKVASEDSVLYTLNAAGEKIPVPVPKGSDIMFHIPGLHHNRKWLFVCILTRLYL